MSKYLFITKRYSIALLLLFFVIHPPSSSAENKDRPIRYIGSERCKNCHEKEYNSFTKYAKKSRSYESIERVKKGLTEEEIKGCYVCHTTGYGKPGGFVSIEKTPYLKNAGCEVCHGPGELHAKTRNPGYIKRHLITKDCEVCHISERVKAFRYKPLIHGGAH
jgi:hypothetical protein